MTIWFQMDTNERYSVRFGLFPAKKVRSAVAPGARAGYLRRSGGVGAAGCSLGHGLLDGHSARAARVTMGRMSTSKAPAVASGRRLEIRTPSLLWALLAVRASGRNVDRRQHNEHANDGVKHDARAVRCPGHDVLPRVCPLSLI
jgi:hypothetical protein